MMSRIVRQNNNGITEGNTALDIARAILDGSPAAVDREALHSTALQLVGSGWSVVPVWGDAQPDRAKAPTIEWREYQQRRPTPAELRAWFLDGNAGGLAVVCGRISGLVVLEFDNPDLRATFAEQNPDLMETRIVKSAGRGLPHFYYEPPADADCRYRGAAGLVELRGDGHYVLTYPTMINGRAYEVITHRPVMALTPDQWQRLTTFANGGRPDPDPGPETEPDPDPAPVDTDFIALNAIYERHLTRTGSRNEALYRTACAARDSGWPEHETASALLLPHVHMSPPAGHASETPEQRAREAMATIASAYSRPRRPLTASAAQGLPTAARERLLQNGQTATARTLDALYMAGWQPGRPFTERDAVTACAPFGVNRATIRKALSPAPASVPVSTPGEGEKRKDSFSSSSSDGEIVLYGFDIVTAPEEHTMYVQGVKTVQKSKGPAHRPARSFLLPAPGDVCAFFGVDDVRADPIESADLKTPAAYRKAINRALIRRRPGQYSKGWLAQRVGVSRSTLHRYIDSDPHIVVSGRTDGQLITRATIGQVPDEPDAGDWGRWLEDGTLKPDGTPRRYPPRRVIALNLLDMGRSVTLVTQERNRYDYRPEPAQSIATTATDSQPAQIASTREIKASVKADTPNRAHKPPSGYVDVTTQWWAKIQLEQTQHDRDTRGEP